MYYRLFIFLVIFHQEKSLITSKKDLVLDVLKAHLRRYATGLNLCPLNKGKKLTTENMI